MKPIPCLFKKKNVSARWDYERRSALLKCVDLTHIVVFPTLDEENYKKLISQAMESKSDDNEKDDYLMHGTLNTLLATNSKQLKIQLLSLLVSKNSFGFIKQNLYPEITITQFRNARDHLKNNGALSPVIKSEPHYRERFDRRSVDHFIEFTKDNFMQDLPYGSKTIKLSTGAIVSIPSVLQLAQFPIVWESYKKFYATEELPFKLHSKEFYRRVIKSVKPVPQKSMAGLDYISADGCQAFQDLFDVLNELKKITGKTYADLISTLQTSKTFLKFDFSSCISKESECAHFCSRFALSDGKQSIFSESCDHLHTESSGMLENLIKSLQEITSQLAQLPLTKERKLLQHSVSDSMLKIEAWQHHIVRAVHQNKAYIDQLELVDNEHILVIKDFAMKKLPEKFREKQEDFFGKKGMSWEISCVLYREEAGGKICCKSFIVILGNETQDWIACGTVLEYVLNQVRKDMPGVRTCTLKTDNAANYKSSDLFNSIYGISKRTGIQIQEYNFSETQKGTIASYIFLL